MRGVLRDEFVSVGFREVRVVEAGRHCGAKQSVLASIHQPRSLPDASLHDVLKFHAASKIRAQRHALRRVVSMKLQHFHWIAKIEMEDLLSRNFVQSGERVWGNEVVNRGAQRSRASVTASEWLGVDLLCRAVRLDEKAAFFRERLEVK